VRSDMDWAKMVEMHDQGVGIGEIARKLNVSRKTVKRYVESNSPPRYSREERGSKLDPYKDTVRAMLAENPLNAPRILREIQKQGYRGGISILKDFMKPIKDSSRCLAEIRYETGPGEQAQADWVDFGMQMVDGERTHLYAFVMVLSYSRMRFVRFTTDLRTETFIECHLAAFEYFGGWPKTILYDNTKNVVIKRAIKASESTFNQMFAEFMKHYGIKIRLCKPGIEGAKTKGKVERAAQYVERDFFLGLSLTSLAQLNCDAVAWCCRANGAVHGTTHEIPTDRWPREGLQPFSSLTVYEVTIIDPRKAARDCLVSWRGNHYSLPWRFAGRECKVLVRGERLQIEVAGDLVATHEVLSGSHRVSRQKEHFEGLLKQKLDAHKRTHEKRITAQKVHVPQAPPVEVERRSLSYYEMMVGGAS